MSFQRKRTRVKDINTQSFALLRSEMTGAEEAVPTGRRRIFGLILTAAITLLGCEDIAQESSRNAESRVMARIDIEREVMLEETVSEDTIDSAAQSAMSSVALSVGEILSVGRSIRASHTLRDVNQLIAEAALAAASSASDMSVELTPQDTAIMTALIGDGMRAPSGGVDDHLAGLTGVVMADSGSQGDSSEPALDAAGEAEVFTMIRPDGQDSVEVRRAMAGVESAGAAAAAEVSFAEVKPVGETGEFNPELPFVSLLNENREETVRKDSDATEAPVAEVEVSRDDVSPEARKAVDDARARTERLLAMSAGEEGTHATSVDNVNDAAEDTIDDGSNATGKRPWFAFWKKNSAGSNDESPVRTEDEVDIDAALALGGLAEPEASDIDIPNAIALAKEEGNAAAVAEENMAAAGDETATEGEATAAGGEASDQSATAEVAKADAEDESAEVGPAQEEIRRQLIQLQMRRVKARKEMEHGKRLFEAGEYEAALKSFLKAEELDPDSGEIIAYVRRTRSLVGDTDENVDEAIIERAATSAKIQQEMSGVRVKTHLDRAENLLAAARTVDTEEELLETTAQMSRNRGQITAAMDELNKAQTLLMGDMSHSLARSQLKQRAEVLHEELVQTRTQIDESLRQASIAKARTAAEDNKREYDETHQRKLEKLMESAEYHLERREYEDVLTIIEQVLDFQPEYAKALALRDKVRLMYRNDWRAKNTRELANAEANWAIDVNKMATAMTSNVIYPEDWEQIKQRTRRTAQGETRREAWMQEIQEKLDTQKVDLEFDNLPLADVIRYLQDQTGLNIVLDKSVDPNIGVTLSVRDMTLGRALGWVLRLTKYYKELKDQAIYISAEPESNVNMQLYPVYDLTNPPRDYNGPSVGSDDDSDSSGGSLGLFGGDDDDDDDDDDTTDDASALIDKIKDVIAPDTWDTMDSVSISLWQDNLLVIHTAAVHAQIDEYLRSIRAAQKQQVMVEGRFVQVVENFLEEIGFQWNNGGTDPVSIPPGTVVGPLSVPQGIPDGALFRHENSSTITDGYRALIAGTGIGANSGFLGGNGGVALSLTKITNNILSGYEVNAILDAVRQNRKGSVLHNPRLLVANGRNAYMEITTSRNYISDYTIEQGYPVPAIATIRQGVVFDVRPVISFDKKYVTVRLRPSMSQLTGQNADSTITMVGTVAGDEDTDRIVTTYTLPVQNPIMLYTRVWTYATVPDGGTILFGGMTTDSRVGGRVGVPLLSEIPLIGRLTRSERLQRDKTNLLLMVRTKIIELDD